MDFTAEGHAIGLFLGARRDDQIIIKIGAEKTAVEFYVINFEFIARISKEKGKFLINMINL